MFMTIYYAPLCQLKVRKKIYILSNHRWCAAHSKYNTFFYLPHRYGQTNWIFRKTTCIGPVGLRSVGVTHK